MASTDEERSDAPVERPAGSPRVSIICSFFQAAAYLGETVESVLAQEFRDFELILVDDGSTDSGTDVAKAYAARDPGRVRYLEHAGHRNLGTCASRNLGLREAKGDLVAFIDADDCWRPSKLAEQVELLDSMPEVDAVCGVVNFWSSHAGGVDREIATGHALNRAIAAPESLLKVYPLGAADPPCPSDLLMRRSIVERIGGFEEAFTGPLQLYEDQAFLAKFFLEGTIFYSDRVWLDYRVHDDSCTMRVNRQGLQPDVRRYCLEWFEAYLAKSRHRHNLRIRYALAVALQRYRHPHLFRIGQAAKSLLRRLRVRREPARA